MILKNSIKQTVRTPIKTALFVILLALVTTFMSFGITMWSSVNQSLEKANNAFTTIGVVEFPREDLDFSPIKNSSFVTSYDQRDLLGGYNEEMTISPDSNNWYREGTEYSIAEFEVNELSPPEATFTKILFRAIKDFDSDYEGNFTLSALSFGGEPNHFPFEIGKKYVSLVKTDETDDYDNGIDKIHYVVQYVMEITSDDYQSTDEFLIFDELLRELHNSVHTFPVYTTNDIESMLTFHQGNTILDSGRFFTEKEYETGANVIMISAGMAERNNLNLGDTIVLDFFQNQVRATGTGNDVFTPLDSDKVGKGTYEIIGIYQELLKISSLYSLKEDTLFIPQKSLSYSPLPLSSSFSNNFISFRLQNGTAEAFLDEVGHFLEDIQQSQTQGHKTTITIYDQGYSKVSGALESMGQTALLLTLIGAGAGLILIVMLGYLFVGRQKRTIAIMYSLGVNGKKALAYLLISVLLVAGLATIVGGSAGFAFSDNVMNNIYEQSLEEIEADTTYSDIYGSDNELEYGISMPNPYIPPLAAMTSVLVLTLLISGIYAANILKAQSMQVLTDKEE